MKLTITVNSEILKRARQRAVEEDSSVNAVLRDYLEYYAGSVPRHRAAVKRLLLLSNMAEARRGDAAWNRDELHEH